MFKKILSLLLIFAFLCSSLAVQADSPTVYYKTSFEDKSDKAWSTKSTTYDKTEKKTGETSLKYTRKDENSYDLLVKTVSLTANTKYSISAWVKTSGLTNKLGDPPVFAMGLEYPQNVGDVYLTTADENWAKLDTGILTSPNKPIKITVVIFMSKGATGTAWLDDFEVLTYGTGDAPVEEQVVLGDAKKVYASSFEDNSDKIWETKVTSYDTAEKHSGERSLKYDRKDASNYELLVKTFTIPANTKYSISVWAKTRGLVSSDDPNPVASLGIEYPQNVGDMYLTTASEEWEKLDTGVLTTPAQNTKITIILFVSKGATGTAWFDDFEVVTYGGGDAPSDVVSDINVNSGVSQKEPTISINNKAIKVLEELNFDKPINDGTLFNNDSSKVTYDNTVFRSGGGSLKIDRSNVDSYVLTSKYFNGVAGNTYFISAWLKSENIQNGRGTFAMEFFDENGGYITGNYLPIGAEGTLDWTRFETVPYKLPDNTAKVSVVFYMSKGATGTVWFDDVKIYREISGMMQSTLLTPAYRGMIWQKDNADIRIQSKINTIDYDLNNAKVQFQLINHEGKVMNGSEISKLSPLIETTFSSADLAVGSYKLLVSMVDKTTGEKLEKEEWPIEVKEENAPKPKSYVDGNGQFLLDGKPFFPLGMYFSRIDEKNLETYSNSPFNTILSYWVPPLEMFQAASEKGIKIIYNLMNYYNFGGGGVASIEEEPLVAAQKVNEFKDQSSLLAWYINDEMDINTYKSRILDVYRAVTSNDKDHPTFIVDYRVTEVDKQPMVTDILGTDPYPVYGKATDKVQEVGEYTRATAKGMPNRPIWQVLQLHNWQNYTKDETFRAPNEEEVRNMTWQAICEGAQGILYYSWFDLESDQGGELFEKSWAKAKKVAQEVKDLVPVILSYEFTPNIRVEGGEWLNYIVKQYEGKTYIFTANNSKNSGLQATIHLPSNATVNVLGENRQIQPSDNKFVDSFSPLAVHLYEVTMTECVASNTSIKAVSISNSKQPLTFGVEQNQYQAYVPTTFDTVDVNVNVADKKATVLIDGKAINGTVAIPLPARKNTFKLEVVAQDGTTKNNIDITIEKRNDITIPNYVDSGEVVTEPINPTDPVNSTNPESFGGFTDIGEFGWASDAIKLLVDKNVIKGTSLTTFEPSRGITRADFTLMLMRALGLKEDADGNFADVSQDDYYYEAVATAEKLGLVTGSNNNLFNPTAHISRQDAFAFLYRGTMLGKKFEHITIDLSDFKDADEVSNYAVKGIVSLAKKGYINGNNGYLYPLDGITRAEVAVLLSRIK